MHRRQLSASSNGTASRTDDTSFRATSTASAPPVSDPLSAPLSLTGNVRYPPFADIRRDRFPASGPTSDFNIGVQDRNRP